MCMGGCGGKTPGKSSGGYSPKKMSSGAKKGGYSPKARPTASNVMSSFGKPSVRMSFSGRK